MTEHTTRSPEMVEGPYFSIGGERRSDLRQGRPGQELLQTADYARGGQQDTFNRTDPVIAMTQGDIESLWVAVQKGPDAYIGRATIAIVPGDINDPIYPPTGRIPPLGGRLHDKPTK